MKAAILYAPLEGREAADAARFEKMAELLEPAGVDAACHIATTKKRLEEWILAERPDLVYSAAYYTREEDGRCESIHALLDEMEVPRVGSSAAALELVLSKHALKESWREQGVRTPASFLARKSGGARKETGPGGGFFPCVLKPNREGNSRGLDESSIVFHPAAMQEKLAMLFQKYDEVLVEQYLGTCADLREFTVAMVGNQEGRIVSPAEITLLKHKEHRIITTEDKDLHFTRAEPVEDPYLRETLAAFAAGAFDAAGVSDYARLDVLMAGGELFAIEINGLPMIPDRWFEVCCAGAGLDSGRYICAIFLAAILRGIRCGHVSLAVPPHMDEMLPDGILDIMTGDAENLHMR